MKKSLYQKVIVILQCKTCTNRKNKSINTTKPPAKIGVFVVTFGYYLQETTKNYTFAKIF